MTATFNIPASTLRAALYCVAKKDVRYYLNGALFDFRAGRIVSTTGHILFCGAIQRQDLDSVIVPREVIETALKAIGRKNESRYSAAVTIETVDSGPPNVRIEVPGAIAAGTCIDGTFPQYERVIPRTTSGELAQFNPDLLCDARDAINVYTGQSVLGYAIQHNGNGPALMVGQNCLVVVKPARLETPDSGTEWYYGPAEVSAAA